MIIGVASGMGFATLETMGYGFSALLQAAAASSASTQTLLLRALLSPAGHVAWTGLTVAALCADRVRPGRAAPSPGWSWPFVAAVLLHAAWDGFNNLFVHVVVGGGQRRRPAGGHPPDATLARARRRLTLQTSTPR